MPSNTSPSWTIAKATSGCSPTITVAAPRSLVMCAIVCSERAANESITSIAVTSTMMPCARNRLTRSIRSWRSCSVSESESAAWTDAMRMVPCFSIGTAIAGSLRSLGPLAGAAYLVAQEPLGFFDPTLQVADRVHLRQVQPDGHQRQRDLRGQAGDDHAGPHQARRVN